MKKTLKWIWLAEKCGAGSMELARLIENFDSIGEIYLADYDTLVDRGCSEHLAEKLADKGLDRAYSIVADCEKNGINIITYDDVRYPKSLASIKDPPAVLYCKGRLPSLNGELCISVVGTRSMSEYGMRTAYKIAYEIASSGAIVVSGMALGIDAVAACAAIAAHGRTVAVLGCGIDVTYPKQHERLKAAILENGAIISEYPPTTEPKRYHFPTRNRIISGLSQGTVVLDANENSGSLITAHTAIIQGRDVYAVPSNIDAENSAGTNKLIRDGAQAVLNGRDIIVNYAYLFEKKVLVSKAQEAEKRSAFDLGALTSLGVKPTGAIRDKSDAPKSVAKRQGAPVKTGASVGKTGQKELDELIGKMLPLKNEGASTKEEADKGDSSLSALESLKPIQRSIFDEMPLDRAVTVDHLMNAGFKYGDIIGALTALEIKGLIAALPGGLYTRK